MTNPNIRYLYDYYKYGGLLPWIIYNVCNIFMPIVFTGITGYIMTQNHGIIEAYLGNFLFAVLLLPVANSVHSFIHFARKIRGMLYAKNVYSSIEVGDNILKCIKWPNIAIKLMDKDIIEHEFEFGSLPASLDAVIIDIFNRGYLRKSISLCEIDVLKNSIHKSIRGNYDIKYSLFVRFAVELLLWPYFVFSRLMNIVTNVCPKFYMNPSLLLARSFRPSMYYRYRGYYEFEFETTKRLNAATESVHKFIAEFPSPLLEACSKLTAGIAGIALLWSIFLRDLHTASIIVGVLFTANMLSGRQSGGYNPYTNYASLAEKFDLDPENPLAGLSFFSDEMPREFWSLLIELFCIIFMPVMCLYLFTVSGDIQALIGKKVINESGEPGIFSSDRVYKHTAFDNETEMIDTLIDPWLEKSIVDFKREFSDMVARGADV